jgi:hypothetical protein
MLGNLLICVVLGKSPCNDLQWLSPNLREICLSLMPNRVCQLFDRRAEFGVYTWLIATSVDTVPTIP